MSVSKDIERYINFLRVNCRLSVSVHPQKYIPSISERLMKFNLHCNDYCLYLKSNNCLWADCIGRQHKIIKACENGSFFGMCHAGVYEFVYPFTSRGDTVGFISVSGYKINDAKSESALKRICEKYGFNHAELRKAYKSGLTDIIPDKEFTDTLIMPLCRMLELACGSSRDESDSLYTRILYYIHQHHNEKITVSDLSEKFFCSVSSISHMFKSTSGCSISDYITKLRMYDAKAMLANSNMSILAVALNVGYTDCSYFSNVFKKNCGISPSEYRKQQHGS
ncbi:MAG: helix-turn-helix domain-containing protein [Clostridiales bacterium]|nr:helix-turn-helix domain-containing protein [Clostridiales bacterium]